MTVTISESVMSLMTEERILTCRKNIKLGITMNIATTMINITNGRNHKKINFITF